MWQRKGEEVEKRNVPFWVKFCFKVNNFPLNFPLRPFRYLEKVNIFQLNHLFPQSFVSSLFKKKCKGELTSNNLHPTPSPCCCYLQRAVMSSRWVGQGCHFAEARFVYDPVSLYAFFIHSIVSGIFSFTINIIQRSTLFAFHLCAFAWVYLLEETFKGPGVWLALFAYEALLTSIYQWGPQDKVRRHSQRSLVVGTLLVQAFLKSLMSIIGLKRFGLLLNNI